MTDPLSPHFLGAYAENDDFFEKTLVEFVRDHVFWRRNFHPDDAPPIATREQYDPRFLDGLARTKRELHQLTAKLKHSVPFFHPRYLGHMVSDLLMPGLIAQLVTTLYNPNNVVEEAAPVTVALEHEVGNQLCRMVGYAVDPAVTPCGLGHLTSGGTLANDEALWLARAVKLYPLAARDACEALGIWPDLSLREADDWSLLNWKPERTVALFELVASMPALAAAVQARRVEAVGLAGFAAAHPLVARLVVLAPGTAHYSWQKAMKLLGLGTAQLLELPTRGARIDVEAFDTTLRQCASSHQPVLAVVGVYGTTEFGTFDPIHELAERQGSPLRFWLHVDAAWGGYVPSLFRDGEGELRPRDAVKQGFHHFPSERVYRTTAALPEADSITVDPHKLGFVPFGAGALLARDRRVFDLVTQDASYVFVSGGGEGEERYRKVGRFSLEGSRPGAPAAACYVNHRVLPLDAEHFGEVIARSVRACETLYDRLPALRTELAPVAHLAVPFEPDCNLVCLAVNPRGNRSLAAANAFGRSLYEAMAVRADTPVQLRRFFGSCTTLELKHLGPGERSALAEQLQVDLAKPDADGVFLLRHTLMNPWLLMSPTGEGEATYLEAYATYLVGLVKERLAAK